MRCKTENHPTTRRLIANRTLFCASTSETFLWLNFLLHIFFPSTSARLTPSRQPARLALNYRLNLYLIFIFIITALAQENFKCPDDYGFYPHHISCDKYWKCDNGAAELKTCGNGLAFEATDSKYLSENCDYHHNVECGDRTQFGKYEVTVSASPYYKCVLCIHNILSLTRCAFSLAFKRNTM